MAHSYEESRKISSKTIIILGVVTIVEVILALLGKGYLISGFHLPLSLIGGLMIIFSLFKAFLIVFEFMHLKYEVKFLRLTVVLPTLLLIWGVIAFLYEGGAWGAARIDGVSVDKETMKYNYPEKGEEIKLKDIHHSDEHPSHDDHSDHKH